MKTIRKPSLAQRIRASVAAWMGTSITLTDHDFWRKWGGRTSTSGVTVSVTTMMQLDAVWSCVRLISETLATLPLNMMERTSAGKRVASQHHLQFLIHDQPNADATATVFWEAVVAAMLLRGEANVERIIYGGTLAALRFLDPKRLTIAKINGKKVFRYTADDGTSREIPRARIWTIPGFSLDGVNGVSVVEYSVNVMGNAIAAEDAAAKTFINGMLQTVYYKVANWLKPSQRKEFKDNVQGTVERGETPLLEGGTDVGTIGINPKDSQLLESRGFSVEQICRWFRVPPWMVGHTEKTTSWGTGIEQQMIAFLIFTLAPWVRRIEQAINKDLLSPVERVRYYAKFSVEGLLRADSAARAAFYTAMVDHGILTRDEVRELEDRPPMGGNAAKLTVQSAMTTLDSLGAAESTEQVRNAVLGFLGLDQAKD
jgi:HK97 family phage portal protein